MPQMQDEFLLAQFTALNNHVTGLFNAGTQRIASFLVFAGLLLAGLGVMVENRILPYAPVLSVSVVVAIWLVGYLVWEQTVKLGIRITQYLRIINETRGYFAEKGPDIARLSTNLMPTSGSLPAWNTSRPPFDPGLSIVELTLTFVVGLSTFYGLQAFLSQSGTEAVWGELIIAIVAAAFIWTILRRRRSELLREELGKEPVDAKTTAAKA